MTTENKEWKFYCVPKDGVPFEGIIYALDLYEATRCFDNEYGLFSMKEFEIKVVDKEKE